MPCGMSHNLGPSLTIIMEDGDQYFEKNNFMSNFFHNAMCLDCNRWMTINEFNMTSWVQL